MPELTNRLERKTTISKFSIESETIDYFPWVLAKLNEDGVRSRNTSVPALVSL